MYPIELTSRFEKRAKAMLSDDQHRSLDRVFNRVVANPWQGDALGPVWFREIRMRDKRLYYVVRARRVVFVDVSDKKSQQQVIEAVRRRLGSLNERG